MAVGTFFMVEQAEATESTTPQNLFTSLTELNKEFHRHYIQARDDLWRLTTENGTVFIRNGSSLTFIHRGIRYPTIKTIPQIFHQLKSIAHIPITVLLLCNKWPSLSDDTLEQYWKQLNNLQLPDSIGSERQSALRIIHESQILIRQKLNNRMAVNQGHLTAYTRDILNDLFVLLDAAAIASLNSMHRAVQNWMNEHNINRHDSSIKVIVIGARAARQNHLDATYFEYLLGANQKRNIFYVEEIYNDEKKIISMFSSWYLEEQLSNILFDDNNRMHSDLLMTDNVRQYMIEQLISC
ncbi:unnamed protein product [Rotaria sp. Silwood1]|nr:unnamed protein product [Rotaria sp. Silwood1]CAF0967347.1 unnamed protein product [Rotaria sp. Silwood1]CAF0976633.1 unnamed protein product [Rotaria sp. Silwood1]CAF3381871.1 unnamed protein product [Rotaria sp. Silwood1]CAF3409074.1 unnamed protein product [Rotaria sp. Silwood1]